MYDFISLNIICPVCEKSLMDTEYLVDHKPSIKLGIEVPDKKGTIFLSSIYGSYNYSCDIETPKNEIVKLFCPHCKAEIKSETKCNLCKAHMVAFLMDTGGMVNICSRIGCKNHFVEITDLSSALKNLFKEREISACPDLKDTTAPAEEGEEINEMDEMHETIKTGAFLRAYCPHCRKTLIEGNILKLRIVKENNESGFLMLSPYLNVYTSKSTIHLRESKSVGDIKCFHCDASLIVKDKNCDKCGCPTAKISIGVLTRIIDFYICSKKGCRWHGLNDKDINYIELEDRENW